MAKRSKCSISRLVAGLTGLLVLSPVLQAQNPAKYIKWTGSNDRFYQVYDAWQPGQPLYPSVAEDENFFISRVKYRNRFTNRNTQAVALTDGNEKKVINWVPIGTTDDGNPNALPSGIFDSDVFSMWNMITHYGNWTAPLVRMPGAFMDAAHKNGVTTSVLASIPWAYSLTPNDMSHGQNFSSMINGGAEKFLKLLKQYGIDGWGVNSEFSTNTSFANLLKGFMADVYARAITNGAWPQYSVPWYALVNNSGSVDSSMDGLLTNNKEWYHYNGRPVSNYQFANYNWTSSDLQTGIGIAENNNRDPFEVYAGMNLQGGQGKNWTLLQSYKTSIGLWGAHNRNMFYESRNEKGSSPEAQQMTYLTRTERFFGNGNQNPAKPNTVYNVLPVSVDRLKTFHGLSAFVTAKSVLQWSLDDMPFYSFFNLGNGRFFNLEGERAYAGEWYNLGMQDYLPTWRYWFAKGYLSRETFEQGLSATFTWDDAWFGGSCLQISGTNTADEFLHLFKTQFALKAGDRIRLRFKVVNGSATIALYGSAKDAETSDIAQKEILSASDIELGEWKTVELTVGTGFQQFRMANKTLAAVALKFSGANNLVLRLGEFSIIRNNVETPAMPTVNNAYTRALGYGYKGVDGKIIFDMARPAGTPTDEPVYNEDVKTAFFKIYSQQKGGEQKFVGATTSWAALCFSAPFDSNGEMEVRFGVSAVGLDGVTESAIAWGDYESAGTLTISDKVVVDKAAIKPNQTFKVSLEDTNHAPVKWELLKGDQVIHTVESATSFTHSLSEVGLYHVRATGRFDEQDNQQKLFAGLVQVSGEAVGAVPEIQTLTFNGQSSAVGAASQVNTLAYTGRTADGSVSRGLNLQESPLGIRASDMFGGNVSGQPAYTLAFWIKFNSLVTAANGIHMLNIREPDAAWPRNNWGHLWTTYIPPTSTTGGVYRMVLRGRSNHMENRYDNLDLKIGVWTHIAYVFENTGSAVIPKLYINGKYVPSTSYGTEGNTTNTGENRNGFSVSSLNNLTYNYMIMFGGAAHGRAGIDGVLDDVKFYTTALTAEQVAEEMYSTNPFAGTAASGLKGFWDFESAPTEHHYFVSPNTNTNLAVGELQDNTSAGEGRRRFVPLAPAYEAGSPFIPGSAFQVKTTAKWDFPRAQVAKTTASREDTAGSASVTYSKQGTYKGTLTLINSWGSDSRTIEAINITSIEGMTDEISLQAFPNPFVETVYVRFAEAGAYELAVYDLSGGMVNRQAVTGEAGGLLQVSVDAPAGTYLLRITKGGILLQTLKLQKK